MKTIYMPIGISGSGKSTYFHKSFLSDFPEVRKILIQHDILLSDIIVSTDSIRIELYDDVNATYGHVKVFDLAYKRSNELLDNYGIAVFDALNVTAFARKDIFNNISSDKRVAIVFKPDIELSNLRIKNQIENNEQRSNVPPERVEKQYISFIRSVMNDEKYDGSWSKKHKDKIKKQLSTKFTTIKFNG